MGKISGDLQDAEAVVWTNVRGTQVLLDAARIRGVPRYVQVSTDEVYGSRPTGSAGESDALRPSNPYAAARLPATCSCWRR